MNTIDWVPVDTMAEILVELVLVVESQSEKTMRMFNAINPQICQWEDLLPTVQEHIGNDLPLVSFGEWVQHLENSLGAEEVDVDSNPGVKLLDFFRSLVGDSQAGKEHVRLETVETEQLSETLRGLQPVGAKWMGVWLKQWGY